MVLFRHCSLPLLRKYFGRQLNLRNNESLHYLSTRVLYSVFESIFKAFVGVFFKYRRGPRWPHGKVLYSLLESRRKESPFILTWCTLNLISLSNIPCYCVKFSDRGNCSGGVFIIWLRFKITKSISKYPFSGFKGERWNDLTKIFKIKEKSQLFLLQIPSFHQLKL